jgi:hypothetical protein
MSFTCSLAASTCTGRRPSSISKSSGVHSAANEYANSKTHENGESGWARRRARGRMLCEMMPSHVPKKSCNCLCLSVLRVKQSVYWQCCRDEPQTFSLSTLPTHPPPITTDNFCRTPNFSPILPFRLACADVLTDSSSSPHAAAKRLVSSRHPLRTHSLSILISVRRYCFSTAASLF